MVSGGIRIFATEAQSTRRKKEERKLKIQDNAETPFANGAQGKQSKLRGAEKRDPSLRRLRWG